MRKVLRRETPRAASAKRRARGPAVWPVVLLRRTSRALACDIATVPPRNTASANRQFFATHSFPAPTCALVSAFWLLGGKPIRVRSNVLDILSGNYFGQAASLLSECLCDRLRLTGARVPAPSGRSRRFGVVRPSPRSNVKKIGYVARKIAGSQRNALIFGGSPLERADSFWPQNGEMNAKPLARHLFG